MPLTPKLSYPKLLDGSTYAHIHQAILSFDIAIASYELPIATVELSDGYKQTERYFYGRHRKHLD